MTYLWILELICMLIFLFLLYHYSSTLSANVRKIDSNSVRMLQKLGSAYFYKIHLCLGNGSHQFDHWWKKNWFIFNLICASALILALWTLNYTWILIPIVWVGILFYSLIKKVQFRKNQILKRIPFVLDMVILNLKSGLDFVSSLEELIGMNDPHPLNDEIRITLQSIHLGESRSVAFRNLGRRTQIQELSNLASVIEQSETMGSSLIELLSLQSDEIRYRIFKQAESEAQKAPVKILIPMLLCIFPVVFIILFVPISLQVLQAFQ